MSALRAMLAGAVGTALMSGLFQWCRVERSDPSQALAALLVQEPVDISRLASFINWFTGTVGLALPFIAIRRRLPASQLTAGLFWGSLAWTMTQFVANPLLARRGPARSRACAAGLLSRRLGKRAALINLLGHCLYGMALATIGNER